MRLRKLFFGLSVFALMCSCTENELETNVPNFKDGEAYISVRLTDANTLTRASSVNNNGGYVNGLETERDVKNAYFYFYDASGNYVAQGSAWNGGQVNNTDSYIEFDANTVVVLKGLTENNYPKYMVTVLNKPTDFEPGATLTAMKTAMAGIVNGYYEEDNTKYFTMSTTSYKAGNDNYDTNNHEDDQYFTTVVHTNNFSTEPIDLDNYGNGENNITPVTVYVERLAAKVSLTSSLTAASGQDWFVGNKTYYEVTTTVAGLNNDGGSNGDKEDPVNAEEKMYISFDGWRLNATAKDTYMSKNINTAWSHTADAASNLGEMNVQTGWYENWNKSEHKRSFWGMSHNYGNSTMTYPDVAGNFYTTGTFVDLNNNPLNYYALYKSNGSNGFTIADDCLTSLTTDEEDNPNYSYSNENTNTSGELGAHFPSAVTSVILAATVYDKDGKAADYVRYSGMLFTEDAFKKNILANASLNLYRKTGNETNGYRYTSITEDDVELEDMNDGNVKLVFTDVFEALLTNTGDDIELVNGNTAEAVAVTGLSEYENKLVGENDAFVGNGYKGGRMYYNIPIEHLNNAEITGEGENRVIPEGKYGVVRNHWYQITINKLEHLGKGIYDPEEVIVPDDEDDKYYLGADIKILSWKIVSQGVEL